MLRFSIHSTKTLRGGCSRAAFPAFVRLFSASTIHPADAHVLPTNKAAGDISHVFPSLSGKAIPPLPSRFADLKQKLVAGREREVEDSWYRLLDQLRKDKEEIKAAGPSIIPEISFEDIKKQEYDRSEGFRRELRQRGVAIVRGVVSEEEALGWKDLLQRYIHSNTVQGFPLDNPAVYELYWSPSQLLARAHPNLLLTQKFLMSAVWHSASPSAPISSSHPMSYADRLRIRMPGDSGFALGPHMDNGSVERWEKHGYGLGGVYDAIFNGRWEDYDAWESSCRLPVQSNLYDTHGGCSAYRMYQGWMAMSHASPGEGHLKVYPLLEKSTAYILLRPFFDPMSSPSSADLSAPLNSQHWRLNPSFQSTLHGATLGAAQELSPQLHPHLDLASCVTSIPTVRPGDYVAWHPDTVHAVDSVHAGKADSSVLYIPCCPLTEGNAQYVRHQRERWWDGGKAGPDFPKGDERGGEATFRGQLGVDAVMETLGPEGRRAMGLERWHVSEGAGEGEKTVLARANNILGFA